MKTKDYSGPYLWLAISALVVPLAVAYSAFANLPRPYTYPEPIPDAAGVPQNHWDFMLRTYVADGLVDYDGLKRDHHFKEYVAALAAADPKKFTSEDDRLAYLCNAYNALVVDGVLKHGIKQSVLTGPNAPPEQSFFDEKSYILAGETVSLNDIENGMVRAEFDEPRIHMALVCAAVSCPSIRAEAFAGDRLDAQLEDQATLFANDPEHVRYEDGKLHLSAILTWYAGDFGGVPGVLDFLAERATSKETLAGIDAARDDPSIITYNEYDWTLNTQGSTSGGGGGAAQSFGSGSIPNE